MTATPGRPDGRSLSWQPRRFTAAALLISSLVSLWLLSPVFWDRLGGDSRAAYAAAQLQLRGGNPYSFPELKQEEAAIDASTRAPAAPSHYSANPYYYPPLMTRLWEGLAPLGDRAFYWVGAAVLLILGLVGLELTLIAISWRGRWLARAFFAVSPATAAVLVSGNPSTLLLAAWGGALLAASRRHGALAGALLAVGWVKPPVGIPVALALLIAGPGPRRRLAAGFALGSGAFASGNVLVGGPGEFSSWLGSLFDFSATLAQRQDAGVFHCCLTSLPALLLDKVSTPIAIMAAAIVAAAILGIGYRRRLLDPEGPDQLLPLALLTALALIVTPYVHINDLVLDALPVLVIASQPLTAMSRVTLLSWGLGATTPLALSAALSAANVELPSGVGVFGMLLGILSAVALVAITRPKPLHEATTPR